MAGCPARQAEALAPARCRRPQQPCSAVVSVSALEAAAELEDSSGGELEATIGAAPISGLLRPRPDLGGLPLGRERIAFDAEVREGARSELDLAQGAALVAETCEGTRAHMSDELVALEPARAGLRPVRPARRTRSREAHRRRRSCGGSSELLLAEGRPAQPCELRSQGRRGARAVSPRALECNGRYKCHLVRREASSGASSYRVGAPLGLECGLLVGRLLARDADGPSNVARSAAPATSTRGLESARTARARAGGAARAARSRRVRRGGKFPTMREWQDPRGTPETPGSVRTLPRGCRGARTVYSRGSDGVVSPRSGRG